MSIKVITFDLDNTLWDVEPVIVRAELAQYQWLQKHRPRLVEQFSMEQLRDFKNSFYRDNPQFAHQISELRIQALITLQRSVGYTQAESERGATDAFGEFMHWRHQVTFYETALDMLEQLSEHYTLGALTNGNADIKKMDAGDYFDFSYSAEQVNASKPDPAMFEAALETCGVVANEVIHVGDSAEHDIYAAHQVGMYSIWMNSSKLSWPGGEPAHAEINRLQDLPAAVAQIDTMASSH